MKDQFKTKQVLIQELASLKQRNAELEQSEADRKRAEEALRQSEERYRTLIETTRDLIYTTDRKGFLTYINPTLERTLGYAHHELEGKSFEQIVAPGYIDSVRDIFRKAMKGKTIPVYEAELIRKDGTRLPVEFNVVTMYDRDGNPSGRYGIGRDVMDRKRAEEALRESEQRLHSIIDGSPIPTFVIGKDHRVIYWNKALEEMSRIRPGDVVGTCEHWKAFYNDERLCMADLLVDETVELVPQWYSGKYIKSPLIEGAYEVTDFFPALGENGKWLRFTAAAIRDSRGMIVAAVETLEDITERKLAEEALRESEEKYRNILENIDEAYFELDLKGNITFFNDSACSISGYSKSELMGMNYRRYASPDAARKLKSSFSKIYKAEEKWSLSEFELIRKDKSTRQMEVSVNLMRNSVGQGIGFRCIARDITERKQAEEALRESEERYRAFFETSRDCVFISSAEGRWIDLNEAAVELFGYSSREELENVRIRDLYADPEGRDRFIAQMREKGYVKEYSFNMRRKDGSIIHVLLTSVAWKDADGNVLGYRGTIRDVTEKRRIEKELKAKHEELSAAYGQLSAYGEELRQKYTELLESQQALHDSETRYRAMFQHMESGVAVYETRDDGETFIFKDFNRAGETIENIKREELIGRSVTDVFPAVKEFGIFDVFQRVWRTGVFERYPVSLYKDGRLSSWRDNFVYKLPTGEIVAIYDDVTKRKHAEAALKEAHDILSKSPAVAFLWKNQEGWPVEFVTENVEALFGYTAKEFMAGEVVYSKILYPGDLDRVAKEVATINQDKEEKAFAHQPYRILTKDGQVKWIEDRTYIRIDEKENITHHQGIVEDITDRKQAEEALQKSEEKYRTILENIEEGYHEVNLAGSFTFFNDSFQRIMGYRWEELMGMNYKQYAADEESARRIFQAYNSVYRTGEPLTRFEWNMIRKDGARRILEVSASLIKDSSGNPQGFRGIITDITDRKRAEDQRREMEERLQRAEKMEVIGLLAGGVAHDLNNVLGVVIGYSELLLMDADKSRSIGPSLVKIMNGAQRAAAIVQDLLTLARRGVTGRDVLNLNKIIADCQQSPEFKNLSSYHPAIKIRTDLEADLLNVSGSSVHLGKTLFNLVSNASEAMPKGGIVTIHSRNAHYEVSSLLDEYHVGPVFFHYFIGGPHAAAELAAKGHFFSINNRMLMNKHRSI